MTDRPGLTAAALWTIVATVAAILISGCGVLGDLRAAGKPAAMLLVTTARSSGSEVSLSRIALARSSNPDVKRFAQRTMAAHQQMIQELRHLAHGRGVLILPVPDETQQTVCAHLLKLSGDELDREYMWEVMAEHAKLAAKFEPQGQGENDPELRQWAARQLPMLQAHLQMAQTLHQQLIAARPIHHG